ncbi:MAG: type III-B CRISPR module-associated protein Cmr3 [Desulfotomaculales bacterium]
MWLFLEPVDVLLFRDGRPFDALSDHRAASLFPPYPSVIQGAIRSHHLIVKNVDLRDSKKIAEVVGTAEDFKGLRIRGPFLARRRGDMVLRYFPLPADAYFTEHHKLRPASPPQPLPATAAASAPTPMLLGLSATERPKKAHSGLWLDEGALVAYLEGREITGIPENALFQRESRFGIGMDDARRTVREQALYEAEFIRPCKDVGLLVQVEGYEGWPAEGVMRLGGEGRGARFTQRVEVAPWPAPPKVLPPRFKVYFATPTYFEGGWQPLTGNWNKFFEGRVELVAAAVHRYESIGGYDWAKQDHKPARRYVPAGSVYYFECRGQARLRADLVQDAVTEFGAEIGFGQIMVKEW